MIEEYEPNSGRVRQIPVDVTPDSAILYGSALSVDEHGRIYVADRLSNAVKIYTPESEFAGKVNAADPVSVQSVQEGEIAVEQMGSPHLVTVLDLRGKEMRQYIELPSPADLPNGIRLGDCNRIVLLPASAQRFVE